MEPGAWEGSGSKPTSLLTLANRRPLEVYKTNNAKIKKEMDKAARGHLE